MAQFREKKYFDRKNVTPGSLLAGNLISFNYKSPRGVHDKNPLVYVLEPRVDRIFGINLHYDMAEMDTLLNYKIDEINSLLEIEWYKKYPAKKNELKKNKTPFQPQMIDKKDLPTLVRRLKKEAIEQFQIENTTNSSFLRCYLYSRITRCSKLVYKVK